MVLMIKPGIKNSLFKKSGSLEYLKIEFTLKMRLVLTTNNNGQVCFENLLCIIKNC